MKRAHKNHWDSRRIDHDPRPAEPVEARAQRTTKSAIGPTAASPCRTPTWWRSGSSRRTTRPSTSFHDSVAGSLTRGRLLWTAVSSFPNSLTPASARAAASRTSHRTEIGKLLDSGQGGLYRLFRHCALAVLNSGCATPTTPRKSSTATATSRSRSCGRRGASSSRCTTPRPRRSSMAR